MCKELDKYLIDLQKEKGMGAVQAFADKLGVTRITLWRYKNGKRKPCMKIRNKIKRYTLGKVLPEHFATN